MTILTLTSGARRSDSPAALATHAPHAEDSPTTQRTPPKILPLSLICTDPLPFPYRKHPICYPSRLGRQTAEALQAQKPSRPAPRLTQGVFRTCTLAPFSLTLHQRITPTLLTRRRRSTDDVGTHRGSHVDLLDVLLPHGKGTSLAIIPLGLQQTQAPRLFSHETQPTHDPRRTPPRKRPSTAPKSRTVPHSLLTLANVRKG